MRNSCFVFSDYALLSMVTNVADGWPFPRCAQLGAAWLFPTRRSVTHIDFGKPELAKAFLGRAHSMPVSIATSDSEHLPFDFLPERRRVTALELRYMPETTGTPNPSIIILAATFHRWGLSAFGARLRCQPWPT